MDDQHNNETTWKCRMCGMSHVGVPMSFAADFPDMFANLKREERETRALIGSDQCVIDEKWFFIRGCLEIPIHGSPEPFVWGVWASVRENVYDEISDCWTKERREKTHGPFKGRLANSSSVYPETLNLKVQIALQQLGARPLFKIEESGHGLAQEQSSGISLDRARELASLLLHQER